MRVKLSPTPAKLDFSDEKRCPSPFIESTNLRTNGGKNSIKKEDLINDISHNWELIDHAAVSPDKIKAVKQQLIKPMPK